MSGIQLGAEGVEAESQKNTQAGQLGKTPVWAFAQVEQRTGDAGLEPCAGLWSLSVNYEKPLKIILSTISLFPPQNFTYTKYTKKSE